VKRARYQEKVVVTDGKGKVIINKRNGNMNEGDLSDFGLDILLGSCIFCVVCGSSLYFSTFKREIHLH